MRGMSESSVTTHFAAVMSMILLYLDYISPRSRFDFPPPKTKDARARCGNPLTEMRSERNFGEGKKIG